jgi:dTDP-4-dehydrorhamnose 3,5-epimerase
LIFTATALPGVFVVEPERREDERGFFARTFCAREFAERGLETRVAQCSVSYSPRRATLRGLHYQAPPHAEAKLVRCTRGGIFDVAVDLRPDSPAFRRHVALALSADDRRMLYVPPGCAHGFETLTDDCEVLYQISEFHDPEAARGVRWDDPAFAIPWPLAPAVISERDRSYPDFEGVP